MTEQQVPVDRKRRMSHRLVGAVVLAALAAIIIPAILDFRANDGTTITGSNIPERPEGFRVEEISLSPQREFREPVAPPGTTTSEAETQGEQSSEPAAQEPAAAPIVESATDKQGWVVQVGSFSSEVNATALRDRLREAGFSAFLDQVAIEDRSVVRVLIGPDARREHSDRLRERLAVEMDLDGVVIGYE